MNRNAARVFTFVDFTDRTENQRRKIRAQATSYSHRDPNRKQRGRNKVKTKHPLAELAVRPLADYQSPRVVQRSRSSQNANEQDVENQALRRNTIPLNISVDSGRGDPFEAYPVPTEPLFGWLLDYYRNVHLPPGIQVVQSSAAEGESYIDWHLREAMTEPCFFYMQILNAATPLCPGRISQNVVLWLRSNVVSSLNEAIADPRRQLSIPTLLTVASIALHERLYGDSKLALEVHGRAFTRMVSLVGGVQCLEIPRIAFALLKWTVDILSSSNADKSTEDLLQQWAPEEMRQKHPGYEVVWEEGS